MKHIETHITSVTPHNIQTCSISHCRCVYITHNNNNTYDPIPNINIYINILLPQKINNNSVMTQQIIINTQPVLGTASLKLEFNE